jgi:predicted N-acetyltransferase YhbS
MSEIVIRPYRESDAVSVGRLIADTFGEFNLAYASPEERELLLGPFRHAYSQDPAHQAEIADVIQAEVVLVAEDGGQIVGVLRGCTEVQGAGSERRSGKLQSLFVRKDRHRRGVGRRLVEQFESTCRRHSAAVIRLQATLFAVPFYQAVGYKRSTGVRSCQIFDGPHFPYQPMKKVMELEKSGGT